MSPRARIQVGLAGFVVVLALTLLVQLGGRADKAYEASVAVRMTDHTITVLLDRAGRESVLGAGWGIPVAGQGATSEQPLARLALPTSSLKGDVEVTLVLASTGPRAAQRPVRIRVGDTPVSAWTPADTAPQTLVFVAPERTRSHSYDLDMTLDVADGPGVRAISAVTRIVAPR